MIKYYLLSLSLIILIFGSCASSSGIGGDSNSVHKQKIAQIKDGALLVRLYVLSPKITALTNLASSSEISNDKREEAQKQLDKLIPERKEYVASIIRVFEENYDYSAVYYIPDSLFKSFHTDHAEGVFYNPQTLEIDQNIKFNHSDYIIFATGKPDYKYSLLNSDLQVMTRPKRYYGVFAGSFLADIFPFVNNEEESRVQTVQKLNESFNEVWEELH